MVYYQDQYCYYFRKPAGIPSSFGKERSFLDLLLTPLTHAPHEVAEKGGEGGSGSMEGIPTDIVQSLFTFFGTEKELWLLNRLDNETSGLLYFAKNPRVYKQFKEMQSAFLLSKYYIAEVYGDIRKFFHNPSSITPPPYQATPLTGGSATNEGASVTVPLDKGEGAPTAVGAEGGLCKTKIQLPIAHHRYNPDRMVVVKQPSDRDKTKWILHHLTTEIIEFQFLPASNTSILLIGIQKGIRHQIRAHLASIGYPICWDTIYSKSDHKNYDTLQLFSVGVGTG